MKVKECHILMFDDLVYDEIWGEHMKVKECHILMFDKDSRI